MLNEYEHKLDFVPCLKCGCKVIEVQKNEAMDYIICSGCESYVEIGTGNLESTDELLLRYWNNVNDPVIVLQRKQDEIDKLQQDMSNIRFVCAERKQTSHHIELGRHSGRTTRIVDAALQTLFRTGKVVCKDHYESEDKFSVATANRFVYDMVRYRLQAEHRSVKVDSNVSFDAKGQHKYEIKLICTK